MLGDDDYVVHLDEETVLTEDAVRGILNFIFENKHAFGQGLLSILFSTINQWKYIYIYFLKLIVTYNCKNNFLCYSGVITYGAQPSLAFSSWLVKFQNHLCTVADSMRVADDLGKHKTQFKFLHKPFFGMKGSFVVTKVFYEYIGDVKKSKMYF